MPASPSPATGLGRLVVLFVAMGVAAFAFSALSARLTREAANTLGWRI